MLLNWQTFQLLKVFSHFHPCDGRLVSIDIRCGKQRSSGFCVQSFQFADGTTVCIVLGSGADILSCVHRFHSNTCHFVTFLELNEHLLKENINSQFSGITCCILLPHLIIFNTEMHSEEVGMIVNPFACVQDGHCLYTMYNLFLVSVSLCKYCSSVESCQS